MFVKISTLALMSLVNATSPIGAQVNFSPKATDNLTPSAQISVNCAPSSGQVFAVGNITVSCNATDLAGNSTTSTFLVTVRGALDQIAILRAAVGAANLKNGPITELQNKLDDAVKELGKSNKERIKEGCKKIDEFAQKVTEESTKKNPSIPAAYATPWLAASATIKGALGCQ